MTISNNQLRKMKSASRLYAVQALFQMEASGQMVDQIVREFEDHRFGEAFDEMEMQEGDAPTFRLLMDPLELGSPVPKMARPWWRLQMKTPRGHPT